MQLQSYAFVRVNPWTGASSGDQLRQEVCANLPAWASTHDEAHAGRYARTSEVKC